MKTTLQVLTEIGYDWALRCFGREHVENGKVRGLRHVEEATELAQALDATEEHCHEVIRIVFSRPKGIAFKEVGGSFLTLLVLCESHGIDPEIALLHEIKRVLNKPVEEFRKRNAEKVNPNEG